MDHEKLELVIIADPPIATTPASGSKGAIEEGRLMEIVETEIEKQPQILEKEKYEKAAIELGKQLENMKAEEEETSEEPFVEIVSKIGSEEDENPRANVLPAPPVVMQIKRQAKEKRIAQDVTKAELDKVKSGNFQQPARNPNDKIKYRRGLGKRGQVLNKALKEGKYILDYQYGRANLPEKLWQAQLAEWMTMQLPWKTYEAAVWACACLFIKLWRLGKNLKKKVGYRVKQAYNKPAASKVPRRWVEKYSNVRRREKSETPDKDRKRKHESQQRDEKRREKSMSRQKRRKENDEESKCRRQKEYERREESPERKQEGKKGTKEHKDSRKSRAPSLDRARNNEMAQQGVPMCNTNAMMQAQQQQVPYLPPNYPGLPMLLPSAAVPPPTQFQMPQFRVMQFQPGQGLYYHQFLVPPGVQMPPPTIIPPIRNVQGEEQMDIPAQLMESSVGVLANYDYLCFVFYVALALHLRAECGLRSYNDPFDQEVYPLEGKAA
uniref:Uncharacterized protein n=1 Tax=Romanomermis culicivorax TaxID=13658 RepID=A0A915JRT2_ROMCU